MKHENIFQSEAEANMQRLLSEEKFLDKVRRVIAGLRAPRNSGEYKYARNEMTRLFAPAASIVVNMLVILAIFFFLNVTDRKKYRIVDITYKTQEDKLPVPDKPQEPEPPQPRNDEVVKIIEYNGISEPAPFKFELAGVYEPPVDINDAVPDAFPIEPIKCPFSVAMPIGLRTPQGRSDGMKKHGAPQGTSDAVLRALRWLKKTQNEDGSWGDAGGKRAPAAITGMALMCFLAHGETPGSSEFGETVEYALEYLIGSLNEKGRFTGAGSHYSYGHAIAAYALAEAYGMTEASSVTHVNPRRGVRKFGSVGVPIVGTDAKIVDVETGTRELPPDEAGELLVKGPQVMSGYWNQPEETAQVLRDGWLYTGDVATVDEDGYFYIVDRKKDLILTAGYNVYPREVEEVLYQHPKVLEAAVIGLPDKVRGEKVTAYVVLRPGETATPQEIRTFCRERLAHYKEPRAVHFRDELPKSMAGKVLRRALQEEELIRLQQKEN